MTVRQGPPAREPVSAVKTDRSRSDRGFAVPTDRPHAPRPSRRVPLGPVIPMAVLLLLCGCAASPSAAGPTVIGGTAAEVASDKTTTPDSRSLSEPDAAPDAALEPVAAGPPCPAPGTDFKQWIGTYRTLAGVRGISAATLGRAFAGITEPNPTVIERDQYQPEFVRPIWEYIDSAVSAARVDRGRRAMAEARTLLDSIETEYAVPREIVAAIWGLESNFGSFLGSFDIVRAFTTLAQSGSRRGFACRELFALLELMDAGHYPTGKPEGSWAGAIGHTQFIPTTQQRFGVDFDRDGRIDLRGSAADALASTANHLSRHGWVPSLPWGFEVTVPKDFDWSSARPDLKRPTEAWIAAGVEPAIPRRLSQDERLASAWIFVPAGHAGPAFLVYNNFSVILRYNYATSYALGIGLLADALAGRPGLQASWPRQEKPLNRDERFTLQRLLNAGGFGAGSVDGIIGRQTRAALRAFQAQVGRPADGFATESILRLLAQRVTGAAP